MKIIKQAMAGTLESSDLLVKVAPNDQGKLDVAIQSEVIKQFGKRIRQVVAETLAQLGITQGTLVNEDKGALDYAIRARVQAAALRGSGAETLSWGQLS